MKTLIYTILCATLLSTSAHAEGWGRKTWKASLAVLATASAADAASSWNRTELNPVLAGQNGRFGAGSVSIKAGLAAGVLLGQHFALKHMEKSYGKTGAEPSYKAFTVANFAVAGVLGGVAAHNYSKR